MKKIEKNEGKIPNSQAIFYWLQYLIHFENLGLVVLIGFMTVIVGLIALSFQYLDHDRLVGFLAIQFIIAFLAISSVWVNMSKKGRIHKARFLIDCILQGKITDNKEISKEWYKKRKEPNKMLFGVGTGFIIAGLILIIRGIFYEVSLLYIFIGIVIVIWTALPSIRKRYKEI